MKKYSFFILSILCISLFASMGFAKADIYDWQYSDFAERIKIRYDLTDSNATADALNVPQVLIFKGTSDAVGKYFWDHRGDDTANHIRICQANSSSYDVVELNYESAYFDVPTQTAIYWVNLARAKYNDNTDIWVYFAQDGTTSYNNNTSTWVNAMSIWHFEGNYYDVMGLRNGTGTNAVMSASYGKNTQGVRLQYTSTYISIPSATYASPITQIVFSKAISSGVNGGLLTGSHPGFPYLLNSETLGQYYTSGGNWILYSIDPSFGYLVTDWHVFGMTQTTTPNYTPTDPLPSCRDIFWYVSSKDGLDNAGGSSSISTFQTSCGGTSSSTDSFIPNISAAYDFTNGRLEIISWLIKNGSCEASISSVNASIKDKSGNVMHVFDDGSIIEGVYRDSWTTATLTGGIYTLQTTITYDGETYTGISEFNGENLEVISTLYTMDSKLDTISSYVDNLETDLNTSTETISNIMDLIGSPTDPITEGTLFGYGNFLKGKWGTKSAEDIYTYVGGVYTECQSLSVAIDNIEVTGGTGGSVNVDTTVLEQKIDELRTSIEGELDYMQKQSNNSQTQTVVVVDNNDTPDYVNTGIGKALEEGKNIVDYLLHGPVLEDLNSVFEEVMNAFGEFMDSLPLPTF